MTVLAISCSVSFRESANYPRLWFGARQGILLVSKSKSAMSVFLYYSGSFTFILYSHTSSPPQTYPTCGKWPSRTDSCLHMSSYFQRSWNDCYISALSSVDTETSGARSVGYMAGFRVCELRPTSPRSIDSINSSGFPFHPFVRVFPNPTWKKVDGHLRIKSFVKTYYLIILNGSCSRVSLPDQILLSLDQGIKRSPTDFAVTCTFSGDWLQLGLKPKTKVSFHWHPCATRTTTFVRYFWGGNFKWVSVLLEVAQNAKCRGDVAISQFLKDSIWSTVIGGWVRAESSLVKCSGNFGGNLSRHSQN